MSKLVTVHSLAWDNENGCGCEIFPTERERDDALREALLSYWKEAEATGLTLDDLLTRLECKDFTDGARFVRETHTIKLEAISA